MDKENVVCIYTMDYYSAIKKNEILPFAVTWMDLEITILSEVSQTQKDKYYMISLLCGIWKIVQMNLQNRNRLRDKENKLIVTKGEGVGEG